MSQPVPAWTALVVPAKAADPLVRAAQARFEPHSPVVDLPPDLVAAHATVLWPFLPPASIDAATLDAVRDTCARHPRRPFVLPRTDVFGGSVYVNPDGQVSGGMAGVYLPPEPAEPLLELMQAIWQRWPECPPYQGVLERVVPHVTVAIVPNDPQQITTVVDFARPFLPIHARPKRSA